MTHWSYRRADVRQCVLTGAHIGGRDDRRLHGKSGGGCPRRVRLHEPLLQLGVLVRRPPSAAGDRRRGHRAGHRRPRPEHRAGVAVRRPPPPVARPHRLLLHRAQLPSRLTAPAQDHGADGRRRGRVVSAGRGGQRGVHRGRGERPGRHPRRAHRVRRPRRGRRLASAGRHRGHLHGRLAEVPGAARGDGDRREVHPPHVPHLGAGRAHRQGQDGPARPSQGRRQGPHPLRLAQLHQLQEGRAQGARRRRRRGHALLQAPAADQLPQPHEDGDHRRQVGVLRRHEHGPGVHRRRPAVRRLARHLVPPERPGGRALPHAVRLDVAVQRR